MNATVDRSRGFERSDPGWHRRVEIVDSVEDVVNLLREYVASLAPQSLVRLPDACRALRVKAEDDVEYWTCRLSQRSRPGDLLVDEEVRDDVFHHFLHASLRISQIRRADASGGTRRVSRRS